MFVLNSDITIGNFRFSGVHGIRITKSMSGITDSATIMLPAKARIKSAGNTNSNDVITGAQFNDGDPVLIKLGYNGDLQTEFTGFVKRRRLDMPLTVECEGYSWILKRNNINGFYPSINLKDLLETAVSGTDSRYPIRIIADADISLSNVLITGRSGFEVINSIIKMTDGCLSCFFVRPDTLWCGFAYSAAATKADVFELGNVSYRSGYNISPGSKLLIRDTTQEQVSIQYSKKLPGGALLTGQSSAFKNGTRAHKKILNNIPDAETLVLLANEKAYQTNYSGFEGTVSTFLQPYAQPGYVAYIEDARFPDKNGNYLIESTEITFGTSGARRSVGIGPAMAFNNK